MWPAGRSGQRGNVGSELSRGHDMGVRTVALCGVTLPQPTMSARDAWHSKAMWMEEVGMYCCLRSMPLLLLLLFVCLFVCLLLFAKLKAEASLLLHSFYSSYNPITCSERLCV